MTIKNTEGDGTMGTKTTKREQDRELRKIGRCLMNGTITVREYDRAVNRIFGVTPTGRRVR